MRVWVSSAAIALALAGCTASYVGEAGQAAPAADAVTLVSPPPRDPSELQVLFWNDEQRSKRFRAMEEWFPGHEIVPAPEPRVLPDGPPLGPQITGDIRAFMQRTDAAGVMVLQDGKKRFEAYRLGFGPKQRWTSFSVAKSFTSTLLGAAVRDGFIASMDDPVTRYIPALKGSAYDGVTVEQLATMTSGVKWNEDYADPNSDVAQMNRFVLEYGPDAIVAQMRELEREAPAGEKWVYKTGETNLLGMLVENAVGLPMADYAKAKIVDPAGFAGGMFWMTDPRGGNIGGCCISLRLADYARMGQFALEGGNGVVPEGWFTSAGSALVDFGNGGFGYGYQWWAYPGADYGAQGIFGQAITILPEERMVLAVVSNWPVASNPAYRAEWLALTRKIAAAD
ncbi:MAG: serine hydrolase [Sphingomonadales bacterium BRH_c3]|nr:MAG: serine hydrolase [Sphingomonadales bacterium BRH_c3]